MKNGLYSSLEELPFGRKMINEKIVLLFSGMIFIVDICLRDDQY